MPVTDNPQLRRLNCVLQRRMIVLDEEIKEYRATSVLCDVMKNPVYRDMLLKIGQLSPDFSLMRVFESQTSLAAIA